MSAAMQGLAQRYSEALQAYAAGPDEDTLSRAYEMGREALRAAVGLVDLAVVHRDALAKAMHRAHTLEESLRVAETAMSFFMEGLSSFEMVQRGYQEANTKLRAVNAELARARDELAQGYETIRAQHQKLLQLGGQKQALTALVVHDLKNPLAVIRANAEFLLMEEGLSQEARESATDSLHAADSMLRMVVNLLDIERSEDGALTPRLVDLDLGTVLDRVRASMSRRAAHGQHTIVFTPPPRAFKLRADQDLLHRLFDNLLDNAMKYTPPGGTIRIEVRDRGQSVEVRVSDQGPGIPEEYRDRVFEKYVRVERDADKHTGVSRGLGLVFCRLAAEVHGGRIWVEENAPHGTCFCVLLPSAP
ncbi:MAG TPA: HAMP domain-containing sensor histidine kinase [Myxococcota bacterium]|nr:HAMP domain-containing sensor histidine kinase [Myxococcota bacterium]